MARKMRDIMSPAPVSPAATESAAAAARAMKEHGIGTVLVLADGKLSGLVTDRDITVRILAENRDPLTTRVGDICSKELAVLGPDDDVDQAARLVRDRAVRRIPVVQDGIPVGIVSIGDLALEKDGQSALFDVRQWPARPARRRPGPGVAEPARRQRGHRRGARLNTAEQFLT